MYLNKPTSVAFAVDVHFSGRSISRLQAGRIRLILPTINEPSPIRARPLYSLPHYGIMWMLNSRIRGQKYGFYADLKERIAENIKKQDNPFGFLAPKHQTPHTGNAPAAAVMNAWYDSKELFLLNTAVVLLPLCNWSCDG